MTNRQLITWITFLSVFAMAARFSMDPDTWWHLRAGEWILENGAVPQADPFSYTRLGATWQYPGWLVQAPLALIYRTIGPGGLNLWTAAMVTLALAFLWRNLEGGPFLRAFVIVWAGAVSGVYWAARPYLVTFLLAAVFLWILEGYRWRRDPMTERRLWWLPVLMILWANSHGGFAVGFILWGIYLAGETWGWMVSTIRRKTMDDGRQTMDNRLTSIFHRPSSAVYRLFFIGALMVLAVCLNPSGPVMLLYPFKTVEIGALQEYIQEWQSPDFHSLAVQPFAWLLLVTFGAVGASGRRLALTDFLLVAGFAYLGLMAGRNVALFALAAPPVLARHSVALFKSWGWSFALKTGSGGRPSRRQAILNAFILGTLFLAVAAKASLIFPYQANAAAWEKDLPVRAVEWLRRERPPGRLFNSYNWGGYLLWELPEYPVFVDGRTDLYNEEVIGEWLQVVRAEDGWQQVLDRWGVKLILLEPHRPVVANLEDNGWRQLYRDSIAVIYGR